VITHTLLAIGVAFTGASLLYIFRTYRETGRTTEAIRANTAAGAAIDRRERTPKLAVWLHSPAPPRADKAIHRLRNGGPTDLDSVVVYRPPPPTGSLIPWPGPVAVAG
jgi:hypothetical protein